MTVYRPTVTRKKADGGKTASRSRFYWGRYFDPRSGRSVRVSLRTSDKSAALTRLRELERRAALEHAGLVDPYEEHHVRPLLGEPNAWGKDVTGKDRGHVGDWLDGLIAKGNTGKHAEQVTSRARRLIDECGFRYWPDVTASRVQTYIGELRDGGTSAQTCNFYLQAVKQFARWLVADRRIGESPLVHLKSENVRTDRRHDRRALEVEELHTLLEQVRSGPVRKGMTGPQRSLCYWLVVETGLRAGEVRSLSPASFNLDASPPAVRVAAGYSKRRRDDVLPLRLDMASALREHLDDCSPDAPAFPLPPKTAVMLRADLEAARNWWIEAATTEADRAERERSGFLRYTDDAGRVVDFHALRHTFVSNLARGGVYPKIAQGLARHSTITLTMDRYSHMHTGDAVAALQSLPDLSPKKGRERMRATGTYDAAPFGKTAPRIRCTESSRPGGISQVAAAGAPGRIGGTAGTQGSSGGVAQPSAGSEVMTPHGTSAASSDTENHTAPGRTRTCDPRFRKPMLYPPELRALVGIIDMQRKNSRSFPQACGCSVGGVLLQASRLVPV